MGILDSTVPEHIIHMNGKEAVSGLPCSAPSALLEGGCFSQQLVPLLSSVIIPLLTNLLPPHLTMRGAVPFYFREQTC